MASVGVASQEVTDSGKPSELSLGALDGLTDRAAAAGRGIRVIRSPLLSALMILAPVGVTGALVAFGLFLTDPMYATGLGAVIAVFIVFQVFMQHIPGSFEQLESRHVIQPAEDERFKAFRDGLERALNQRAGFGIGLFLVVCAVARFPVAAGGVGQFFGDGPRSLLSRGLLGVLDIGGEALLGFALGCILWRMIVVAIKVGELGRRFELRLQLNHPDGCGGFRPLGNLCLWNALIVSIPAIYLAWWVIVGPRSQYGTTYVGLQAAFLAIVAGLAPITFLVPLLSVHRAMLREARRLRAEVDELGQAIDRLSRKLLEPAENLSPDDREKIAADLELRQRIYGQNDQIPTWPIDTRIALRFGAAQIIPLLGLTGLSKPVLDVIDGFVRLVRPT